MNSTEPLLLIIDRLPESLPLDRSESEWLLTLLSVEELQFIFGDAIDDENGVRSNGGGRHVHNAQ